MARVSQPEPGGGDHFATLGLPRRAELDADLVRSAFQERAREGHPDAGGDAAEFEAANRAHSVLADPVARLRHLFELQFGSVPDPAGAVAGETMDLFEAISSALGRADELLKRRASASTALSKALLASEETEVLAETMKVGGVLRARHADVVARFPSLDQALRDGRASARAELGDCYRELAFLAKWERQVAERMAAFV